MICWVDLDGAAVVRWWVWVGVVLLMMLVAGGAAVVLLMMVMANCVVDDWQVVGRLVLNCVCVGLWVCS